MEALGTQKFFVGNWATLIKERVRVRVAKANSSFEVASLLKRYLMSAKLRVFSVDLQIEAIKLTDLNLRSLNISVLRKLKSMLSIAANLKYSYTIVDKQLPPKRC